MGIGLRHYRNLFDSTAHESSETVHQVAVGAGNTALWRLVTTGNFVGPVSAGTSLTAGSGNYNTLGGVRCGAAITTGDENSAFGYESLKALTTGWNNDVLGFQAGIKFTTAKENVVIGSYACSQATATSGLAYNVFVGYGAGYNASAGDYNVGIGYGALRSINDSINSIYNVAIGNDAGAALTSGKDNTLIGTNSGQALTTSGHNVGLGKDTFATGTTGVEYNVALGQFSLYYCNGERNVGCGANSLFYLDAGNRNSALGYNTGEGADFTSSDNVFIGYEAGPTAAATITDRGYFHNAQSDTPLMSHDYANTRIGVGITFAALTNIMTFPIGSATDPIADAWPVHPSDRTTKHELGESSSLLDGFMDWKTYRYKRKAIVSRNEVIAAGRKIATKELRAMGINGRDVHLMDMSNLSAFLDTAELREDLEKEKAGLPKFATKRVGIMIDDPETPPEILIEYGDNGAVGIDTLAYIGYLHAVLKELTGKVLALEEANNVT